MLAALRTLTDLLGQVLRTKKIKDTIQHMSGRDRSPRPLHRSQRRPREVRGAIGWFGDELRAARSQLDPNCCWTEEEERGREAGRERGRSENHGRESERERERPAVYSRTKLFLRSSFSLECASNPRDFPVWTRNSLMVTFGKKASFQLPLSCFTAELGGYSAEGVQKYD